MLKCKVNKKKKRVRVKACGDMHTIVVEVLALFKTIHRAIEQKNPEDAQNFRNMVTAAMLDPASPLWKED